MLQWRVKEMLIEKGYPHPHKWLLKRKMSSNTVVKILHNTQQRVELRHLNSICEAAWCTPNDLFLWQPAEAVRIPDTHPLQALRARAIANISHKIKTLSAEQIIALDKMVDGLKEL